MKHELREKTKIYSKELLKSLFVEFYTRIPYIQKQLGVSDKTAQKYLDSLVDMGFLTSEKIGRNFAIILLEFIIKHLIFRYSFDRIHSKKGSSSKTTNQQQEKSG